MADDTEPIQTFKEFHPTNCPRGMMGYDLNLLTQEQKKCLLDHKLNVVRENHKYLKEHPEIQFLLRTLIKELLKARPKIKMQSYLAKYLKENWNMLSKMMEEIRLQNKIVQESIGKHVEDSFDGEQSMDWNFVEEDYFEMPDEKTFPDTTKEVIFSSLVQTLRRTNDEPFGSFGMWPFHSIQEEE